MTSQPVGLPEALRAFYWYAPKPESLWPGETDEEFGYPVGDDGTVASPSAEPQKEPR